MHIAIDPGAGGGIVYSESGSPTTLKMPQTPSEVVAVLQRLRDTHSVVVIEELPKFVKAIPGSAVAVMFTNFGMIIGASLALGYRLERVPPQKWQKDLGMGSSKSHESKSAWKNHLKGRAMELFPQLDVTLATSDALLIWEWRRKFSSGA
jgi:hypothetical protein